MTGFNLADYSAVTKCKQCGEDITLKAQVFCLENPQDKSSTRHAFCVDCSSKNWRIRNGYQIEETTKEESTSPTI